MEYVDGYGEEQWEKALTMEVVDGYSTKQLEEAQKMEYLGWYKDCWTLSKSLV